MDVESRFELWKWVGIEDRDSSNDESGWFIEPTIILTKNPDSETMVEEIFGPVLTIYVYDDKEFDQVLELCDKASPYALTGSIFSSSEENIQKAYDKFF